MRQIETEAKALREKVKAYSDLQNRQWSLDICGEHLNRPLSDFNMSLHNLIIRSGKSVECKNSQAYSEIEFNHELSRLKKAFKKFKRDFEAHLQQIQSDQQQRFEPLYAELQPKGQRPPQEPRFEIVHEEEEQQQKPLQEPRAFPPPPQQFRDEQKPIQESRPVPTPRRRKCSMQDSSLQFARNNFKEALFNLKKETDTWHQEVEKLPKLKTEARAKEAETLLAKRAKFYESIQKLQETANRLRFPTEFVQKCAQVELENMYRKLKNTEKDQMDEELKRKLENIKLESAKLEKKMELFELEKAKLGEREQNLQLAKIALKSKEKEQEAKNHQQENKKMEEESKILKFFRHFRGRPSKKIKKEMKKKAEIEQRKAMKNRIEATIEAMKEDNQPQLALELKPHEMEKNLEDFGASAVIHGDLIDLESDFLPALTLCMETAASDSSQANVRYSFDELLGSSNLNGFGFLRLDEFNPPQAEVLYTIRKLMVSIEKELSSLAENSAQNLPEKKALKNSARLQKPESNASTELIWTTFDTSNPDNLQDTLATLQLDQDQMIFTTLAWILHALIGFRMSLNSSYEQTLKDLRKFIKSQPGSWIHAEKKAKILHMLDETQNSPKKMDILAFLVILLTILLVLLEDSENFRRDLLLTVAIFEILFGAIRNL